jgi:hypothetical protein
MNIEFWWESEKERDLSEDLVVGGRIMDHREVGWGCMDWIHLAQDSDQRRAVVNMAMNLRLLQNIE